MNDHCIELRSFRQRSGRQRLIHQHQCSIVKSGFAIFSNEIAKAFSNKGPVIKYREGGWLKFLTKFSKPLYTGPLGYTRLRFLRSPGLESLVKHR